MKAELYDDSDCQQHKNNMTWHADDDEDESKNCGINQGTN